jgi:hypothetical protein
MRAGLASFGGVVYGAASYPSGPAPHVLLRRTVGAWEQFTQGTSVEPQVIAADGLQIFVAGRTQDPALRPNGVMKWNGHEWSPAGGPFERPIATLGLWNGQFIVGGSFTNAGPFKTAWLARWAESYWEPVGPALNGEVRSLHAFKGELYVAGNFSRAGDLDVPGLAIWNGTAWRTLPAPAEMANLSAVAVSPDGVVGVATATSRQRIWLWRADSWTLISDNPTLVPSPKLLWRGHDLHVTGGFVELGGIVSDVYGIWHEPGPWLRMDPRSPTDLALGVTGASPLRYEIQRSTDLRNWSKWATNSLLAQEQSFSVGDELSEPGASFRLISKD